MGKVKQILEASQITINHFGGFRTGGVFIRDVWALVRDNETITAYQSLEAAKAALTALDFNTDEFSRAELTDYLIKYETNLRHRVS